MISRRAAAAAATLAVVAGGALGGPVSAHELRRSESSWRFTGDSVQVAVSMPRSELGGAPAESVRAWFSLGDPADQTGCTAGPTRVSLRPSRAQLRWTWRCPRPAQPVVHVALGGASPGHVHAARVVTRDGRVEDLILTIERSTGDLRAPEPPQWWDFLRLGALHVAGGLDHVAFVVALMLMGGSLGTILLIASGFTLGHSATLGLAALGIVAVDTRVIEVLVGLSVAYAALACFGGWLPAGRRWRVTATNLTLHGVLLAWLPSLAVVGSALATSCHLGLQSRAPDRATPRAALAGLFGLVHGFAFAGTFSELLAGGDLAWGLLSFNVGVELAQALIIIGAVAGLRVAERASMAQVRPAVAACVLAAGICWTWGRI